jgi:hypothetical protein
LVVTKSTLERSEMKARGWVDGFVAAVIDLVLLNQ